MCYINEAGFNLIVFFYPGMNLKIFAELVLRSRAIGVYVRSDQEPSLIYALCLIYANPQAKCFRS